MKKLLILFVFVLMFGCTPKVYVGEGLDYDGVLIWDEDVYFVYEKDKADVICYLTEDFQSDYNGLCITRDWGQDECKIRGSSSNNNSLLAHEFGHFLGYDHSDDERSIMHYFVVRDRDLNWFSEFGSVGEF